MIWLLPHTVVSVGSNWRNTSFTFVDTTNNIAIMTV